MERNFSYENFPGIDPERRIESSEFESTPEKEKSQEELLLEAFESGTRFDNEDERNRRYNALLDTADELQEQINETSEAISQATTQLAALPLTPQQLVLLTQLEQLMTQRQQAKTTAAQSLISEKIEAKTKELASLPVTDQQGGLLDAILELMDARQVQEASLRAIFSNNE